ncbi:MAG TPA: SDR family oxidoreductase [Acidimicrobiales bacterium]|nr:SDR family oxidoreductase [Acidimicrobiales bacterium]
MDGELRGKVALVTGSSSGIGAATARRLGGLGAFVVVNSARSVEEGRALANELPDALYLQGDISDPEQSQALVDGVLERYGRLDVLINNAGTTTFIAHHDLEAASVDVWRRIFDVNVFGTWQLTVAAVPHLQASGDGAIVNVTSVAGLRPTGSSIPYAASKAALTHMTILLANVLGPSVRVNAVAPGLVDTPWTAEWTDARTVVEAIAPLRRVAEPDDVARVIVDVAQASYMTGEVVTVDGGMHLR